MSKEQFVEDTFTSKSYNDQVVLVNLERRRQGRHPLRSSSSLDDLAHRQAKSMAQSCRVFHSVSCIEELMLSLSSKYVAENVQRGIDVAAMHEETMSATNETINRANILSKCFDEFGSGSAMGEDGRVYICQVFRKSA